MRNRAIDITGNRYGKLVVIEDIKSFKGRKKSLCKCDCGNVKLIRVDALKSGATSSCGCILEYHGMTKTLEYKIWDSMRQRCTNKNNKKYDYYGGKGITVCDEWMTSFEAFYRDMGPRPSLKHSIDRIEGNKGYYKDNCRWATKKEQSNNLSSNLNFTYNGETKSLMQWSLLLGFNYHNAKYRIHCGMLFEVAIKIEFISKSSILTLNNISKTILEWCAENNVSFVFFRSRLGKGWTLIEALTPINKKLINFNPDNSDKGPMLMPLEHWCGLLGMDCDSTALRILRGEEFDNIVKE